MAVFRYYISREPHGVSPLPDELSEILADDRADAIERIWRSTSVRTDWPTAWIHVLVWVDHENRGFESTCIK